MFKGIRAAPTRRSKAVSCAFSLSRSRPLERAKKQTDRPQTRANTRGKGRKKTNRERLVF